MTDEPSAPTDIDTLMLVVDECISAGKPIPKPDLDAIIAYQRKMRAQREAGVKTKKPKDAPAAKIDISALLQKPAGSVQRRF